MIEDFIQFSNRGIRQEKLKGQTGELSQVPSSSQGHQQPETDDQTDKQILHHQFGMVETR